MHVKRYPIQIWFLSDDLYISAQQHSNKLLSKSIQGCFNALIAAYFYCFGIRNKKLYDHYFDKCRVDATIDHFFPCWPIRTKPKFQQYDSRVSKWCRKCKEHFDYIKRYMDILCNEYDYRFGKAHFLAHFLEWIDFDAPKIVIPEAKIHKIVIEWKSVNPKYRRKDLTEGYRLQCKAVIGNDGLSINDFTKRDIPEWLLEEQSNIWME